jgi:DTW domain
LRGSITRVYIDRIYRGVNSNDPPGTGNMALVKGLIGALSATIVRCQKAMWASYKHVPRVDIFAKCLLYFWRSDCEQSARKLCADSNRMRQWLECGDKLHEMSHKHSPDILRIFWAEDFNVDSMDANFEISPEFQRAIDAHAERTGRQWVTDNADPLAHFHMSRSRQEVAEYAEAHGRAKCDVCGRASLLYCHKCQRSVGGFREWVDEARGGPLRLPVRMCLLHAVQEKLGKSTGLYTMVLAAPGQVSMHHLSASMDNMPAFDPRTHVLLYPSDDSVAIADLEPDVLASIETVVAIEATWHKANTALRHPQLKRLRRIHLNKQYETAFWRLQHTSKNFLSTNEAVYYCEKEFDERLHCRRKRSRQEDDAKGKEIKDGNKDDDADDDKDDDDDDDDDASAALDDLMILFAWRSDMIQRCCQNTPIAWQMKKPAAQRD